MNRRMAITGLLGLTGAGVSFRLAQGGAFQTATSESAGAARAQLPRREVGGAGFKSVTLSQVPIGGGGFVTGIDISTDGQRFACRTDVANAYVRDSEDTGWRPLFSPSTMQPSDYDPLPALNGKADGQGVAGIRIAPSNKDVIVASYYGYIWKSVDGGRSIRRTRLPQKAMPSNAGGQRLFNRTIDIHSSDPQRILIGTCGDGVWFTLDGGGQWERAKLPEAGQSFDGQPGIHLVLFDIAAPNRVYAFVTGVGLLRSDSGPGGDFALLPGGPTTCSSMAAGADGTLYLCERTKAERGSVWRYAPNHGWTSSRPEHEAAALAIDPHQSSRLIVSNPNGYIMRSDDSGQSWRSVGGAAWDSNVGEVAWTRRLTTMFPAEIRFDPVVRERLWFAQGVGVAKAAATSTQYRLSDWSAGIEELCAVSALSVPGGKTFLSAWDKSFWRIDDFTSYANDFRYPLAEGKRHSSSHVGYGSYMDFAGDDPAYVVGIVAPSDDAAPGFSEDGGDSWHAFPGRPATGWGVGGCIAASSRRNIILLPSNNGIGIYTLDGGRTWEPIRLDGANPTGGFANAFHVKRKNISADKSRPGTFALVYTVVMGDGYGEPLGGFWVTSDGGKSWKQFLKGVIGTKDRNPLAVRAEGLEERQFWQCQLDYVPGFPGELIYTPHADYAADRLFWSRDDGRAWTEPHAGIRNVRSFGFGKAAAPGARPVIYFWGEFEGKEGLYASFDWFASEPRLITRFPSEMLAQVSSVTGDANVFGRVYVGTSCAGWVRVDIQG